MTARDILVDLAGPADLALSNTGNLDVQIASFNASEVSRREALWSLSERTGVTIEWASTARPRVFMGVPEHEERKAPAGVTTVTEVKTPGYETYLRLKAEGRITHEERLGDYVYYAVEEDRCVHQPGGGSGIFVETRRLRAKVPPQRQSQPTE
jgi:hypothetical protein